MGGTGDTPESRGREHSAMWCGMGVWEGRFRREESEYRAHKGF